MEEPLARAGQLRGGQPRPCHSGGAASWVAPVWLWTWGIPASEFRLHSKARFEFCHRLRCPVLANSLSIPRSLRFLNRQPGAGVVSSQGGDQVEGRGVLRLWCPETSLACRGCAPEPPCQAPLRALCLPQCVVFLTATLRSVPLSLLSTEGETSTEPPRPLPKVLRPSAVEASLRPPAPLQDPMLYAGVPDRTWRLEPPLSGFPDSRGLVPAVVTTTGGQWGAGRGGGSASAPPQAEGSRL